MGVIAESAHGLGLSSDPQEAFLIEPVSLDEGEGHVAVELRVMCEVDALLATFAEKALHLVTAVAERAGLQRNVHTPRVHGCRWCGRTYLQRRSVLFALRGGQIGQGVPVLRNALAYLA